LLCNADISVDTFQNGNHLLGRNHPGVINDRIDLTKSLKAAVYLKNPWQPFQGRFSDTVSMHEKDDSGVRRLVRGLSFRKDAPDTQQQKRDSEYALINFHGCSLLTVTAGVSLNKAANLL
jgi:hypothetical protein